MPILHHKRKGRVLFIHIPKAAGSSVEKLFRDRSYKIEKLGSWDGPNQQHAVKTVYETWGEFDYKFTIVRHPLERFVSALGYRTIHAGDADTQARDVLKKYENGLLPASWGNHLQPQVDFLSDDVEIFRFEDDFLSEIGKVFDLPGPYPHENKSRTTVTHKDLSDDVKATVLRIYAEDYKVLGYEAEPPERIPDATSPSEGE
jgi:Sulfotransferase family